ncbi:MAG: DUF2794 domain-containing protein [Pseudomonadota bacterium]|nr:DUF2794 domain-containing protein [Pseudomonadota bacterium]
MSGVVNLSKYRRSRKRRHVCFNRLELNKLLSLYSSRVIRGEWKDYAISHGDGVSEFSIFRNSIDRPAFTVIKYPPGSHRKGDYIVYADNRPLKQGESLESVLRIFERELKLVSP